MFGNDFRYSVIFFPEAEKKNIGIIVRVPLASGLLAGKFTKETVFEKGDHRFFNREGKYFDKGETFAGVPFEIGLKAAEHMKKIFPDQENLALYALRWVLMFDETSCVIPGASRVQQAEANVHASDMPHLSDEKIQAVKQLYEQQIKPWVHHLW